MTKTLFEKIAILGLGLIGGSIALDIKGRGLAKRVVGYNRSAGGRKWANLRKACDGVTSHPEEAVRAADLVILALPVGVLPQIARRISGNLKKGAIVTDVGSTKLVVVKKLDKIFSKEVHFVGGHPIAGTEKSGMKASLEGLFVDRWWLFTPTRFGRTDRAALKKLANFARSLGARTAMLSPRDHDRTVAAVSHLPHLVAYSLVDTVCKIEKGKVLKFAAGGFKDYTRIAASSAQMWSDICVDNRDEILRMIGKFEISLAKIKRMVSRNDKNALYRFMDSVAKLRRKI